MFEPYNYNNVYNQYGAYNPYYGLQPQQVPKQNQQLYKSQGNILQGKVVDSLEVVKATDIPYDGSISYFPLTDNSAIITKQLQTDGTSKVIIYKPEIGDTKDTPKYITEEEFKDHLKSINNSKEIKELKDDIKALKRKIEDITDGT